MTNEEIRARFNAEVAEAYSQRKPVWLPEYDKVLGLVVKVLEPILAGQETVRVLDLGAGTGNLSRRILKSYKNSRVTLVDFSQNMLDEVPNVLSSFASRYEVRQADFWQMDDPAGEYAAVVSSFALHHGRGDEVYRSIYRKIHAWLKPGGMFACCDVVDGDTPELAALNLAGWRQYLNGKLTPEHVERMFANYRREDSPISLRKHLSYLAEAGFEATDVLWKRFNFAVYVGIKNS
ncbi:MAG TPA: methyltransferase domain-containing protein [Anaerolineales bacterium]|nr:methyltransferase domain-containing protein [Anaerolineales bacterium]